MQGNKRRTMYAQSGLPILPVFTFLFSAFDIEQIGWLPFDRLGLSIPLVESDAFCGARMMFSLPESYHES